MNADNFALLRNQLAAALDECDSGRGEPAEVAMLGGLLARFTRGTDRDREQLLGRVQAVLAPGRGDVRAAISLVLDGVRDSLEELSAQSDSEDRAEVLLDLDEACAGAWLCGHPALASELVEEVCACFAAAPHGWCPLASLAGTILAELPPHPDDPALKLWRALAELAAAARDSSSPATT